MFEFLRATHWNLASAGSTRKAASWTLDRNWHRSEAERHLMARNFREALPHLVAAVEESEARHAPPKLQVRLRLELADTQRRLADGNIEFLALSESTIRRAIEIAAAASDGEEYVNCLDALADVFADQKNYAALEKVEEQAVHHGSKLHHPDPLRMAKRVHRLAIARHKNGDVQEAVPALEKSIALHERTCDTNGPEMAALLDEVGGIYHDQADYERAKNCLRRSLRIHEKLTGADSPEALAVLQKLATAYEEAGDLDGAAQQYERCLALKQRKLGVKNIEEVAVMQYSLANLHAGWGNLPRARELMSECIAAFRRDGGPRLAVAYELLAQVEERSGRFHGALKELESAAKVWEKCNPSRQSEVIRNMDYRADILDQLRKFKEAGYLREMATTMASESSTHAQTA